MDYRTGKCSQCGAEYKVPASFAHNAARCKQCKGVVHLGPPQGAPAAAAPAATAMPAKKVVPKPAAATAPEVTGAAPVQPAARPAPKAEPAAPSEKKGGTLERLRAERTGATPPPAAPAPKAAAPAPKVAASAPKVPVASPPQKAAVPPPKGPSARKTDEEDASSGSKRGRAAKARPEKKKAPVGGILSVVGLVAVAAGLILFRDKLFGAGTPSGTEEAAVNAGESAPGASAPAADPSKAPETASTETPPADPAAVVDAPPEAAPEPAKEAKKPADSKVKDPASIDLTAIADFGPTPDTSAEEWAQMQEWVLQWMDPEAGAAGNRARMRLMEMKRKAVPAILNHFKKLDFATDAGRRGGDQCQKTLKDIWNGTNFDWRYADEAAGKPVTDPNDVWFCKRSTELWCSLWKQAEENIEVWIQRAKLEEKDPEEAARLREAFGKPGEASPPSGDEDLEVD